MSTAVREMKITCDYSLQGHLRRVNKLPSFELTPRQTVKSIEKQLRLLLSRERTERYLPNPDYISFQNEMDVLPPMYSRRYRQPRMQQEHENRPQPCGRLKPAYRLRIAVWLFDFEPDFKVYRGTVLMALNYFDRYLSACFVDRKNLQLVAIACIFLATKFSEVRNLKSADLSQLAEGAYSVDEIRKMEIKIINTLQWKLNATTTLDFFQLFLLSCRFSQSDKLLHTDCQEELDSEANFCHEITREFDLIAEKFLYSTHFAYEFLQFSPSHVALCAILCSFKFMENEYYYMMRDSGNDGVCSLYYANWVNSIYDNYKIDLTSIEMKICCDLIFKSYYETFGHCKENLMRYHPETSSLERTEREMREKEQQVMYQGFATNRIEQVAYKVGAIDSARVENKENIPPSELRGPVVC